ncbi:MAG: PQQ-binding-like beta-propeller repeat protein [Thermoguttaceae bacterium]|jgi:outer membrane protein assembly factor BamB
MKLGVKWLLTMLVACQLAAAAQCKVLAADQAPQWAAPPAAADQQPSPERPVGWRAQGDGQYPSADPVTKWSAKENVLWRTDVGAGHSSPIVVGRRVLVTAEPDVLVCLDLASGRELWRKVHRLSDLPAALGAQAPKQAEHYGDATPTPVSDGKWVWVFFNTGIVACHDLAGKCRWLNWYDMRLATGYGRTASPLLVGQRLLVHFGPLVCLEAATGKMLWQNPGAKAAYGTPAPARIGDVDVVVTPKGQIVRIADGKILATGLGPCGYTSPVVLGGVVYCIDRDMSAVQLPKESGERIEGRELWAAELEGEFFASPLIHDGRIYAVDRSANYFVIDAASGKTLLKTTLELAPAGRADGPNIYTSLCLAGKHIFVGNDAGQSMLLEPGD